MPGFPGGPIGPGLHEPALGLTVGPVNEQVRAQVKLPAGMGLMVEDVQADGPAAKAGVERFDILRKFDDQLLCSPDQLMALARAAGEGKEIRLALVHAGQERELTVTLGNPDAVPKPGRFPGGGGRLQARAQAQARAGAQAGGHARAEARGGNGPGGQAGGGQSNHQHHETHTQRAVAESNDQGSVEIQETDGRRTVRVKDAGGREVHAGPLDTDADWQAVPEAFRDMVRSVADKLGG